MSSSLVEAVGGISIGDKVVVGEECRPGVVAGLEESFGTVQVKWGDNTGSAWVFSDEVTLIDSVPSPRPSDVVASHASKPPSPPVADSTGAQPSSSAGGAARDGADPANVAVPGPLTAAATPPPPPPITKKRRNRRKKTKKAKKDAGGAAARSGAGGGDDAGAAASALVATNAAIAPSSDAVPPVSFSAAIAPADPSADRCNVCARTQNLKRCAGCEAVWYCSSNHQRADWSKHKGMCKMLQSNKRSTVIYGEKNSKYVGTLRWQNDHKFDPLPVFPTELHFLYSIVKGWNGFLSSRYPGLWQNEMTAEVPNDDVPPRRVVVKGIAPSAQTKRLAGDAEAPLVLHPSVLDGLSYPMSVIYAIRALKWKPAAGKPLTMLLLGATAKTEQRLLEQTNYFDEFLNYFNVPGIHYVLVGPELGAKKGGRVRTHQLRKLDNCTFSLVRGTVQDYMTGAGKKLDPASTLAVGYNTGHGSANVKLMASWAPGLYHLAMSGILSVFTCANENIDARGEMRVMKQVIGANVVLPASPCPFRACSTFHAPAMRETDWSCANCAVYAVQGFAGSPAAALAAVSSPSGLHRQLSQIAKGL